VPDSCASHRGDFPLVSALINTYNYGRFVEEAVESVLAQDYPADRLEIIVADDGSTDDTPTRMERFSARVRYLRLEHRGQAAALNAAIAASHGEFVAFLDADDLWRKDKVRRVVEAFQAHSEAGMVYHAFEQWRTDGQPVVQQEFQAISGMVSARLNDLLAYDGQATSGQAFRRSVLEEMLPLPEAFIIGCSDGYLCYNCIFHWPVVAIAEPLTRYRLHGENLFSFDRPDPGRMRVKFDCWKALMQAHASWLERQGISLEDPKVAAFRKRQELVAEMMSFALAAPGRLDFFRHLRKECRLYRPLWSHKYRAWKALSSFASLILGFSALMAIRKWYQGAITARRLRAALLPRLKGEREFAELPGGTVHGRVVG
jgi:glycosyltransferase involved in cell wall biosynthesis